MKGKFGIAALMFSGITFAVPVSTPNQLSDTPIISGGGSVGNLSMNNCRAYQTDGTAINLSGGETLVFYGGGRPKNGGYLATKTTYSGTAYVKLSKNCFVSWGWPFICYYHDAPSAIGLFARNTEDQQDFIAGAGGGFDGYSVSVHTCSSASGGGWYGEPAFCTRREHISSAAGSSYIGEGGSIYGGAYWFHAYSRFSPYYTSAGFFGGRLGGGASSISAWYNHYTKDYTSPTTSATITGGGITGRGRLYVCN
jgi:hypothetical protein